MQNTEITHLEFLEQLLIEINDQLVLLDKDVAEIYQVTTKEINQAVSNNPDKFPDGYVFEIDKNRKNELIKNFDRFSKLKHSTVLPKAFTEKGLYMLATILKSQSATQTTLLIIETFAKIRTLSRFMKQLPEAQTKEEQQSLMQRSGEIIADVLDDALASDESETTIELNLAVLKFKHTIKKKK